MHLASTFSPSGERQHIDFAALTGRASRLRPAGGRQGPDRGASARGGTFGSTSRRRSRTARRRASSRSATATEGGARSSLRRRRRLRRLPRGLPLQDPRRRPHRLRARLPVRLARHPRRGRPLMRRAHLRVHERGFALYCARAPTISRLYLQVAGRRHRGLARRADLGGAHLRLAAAGWRSTRARSLEKAITPMRSFVCEPMRYGRLFLARRRRPHRSAHGRQGHQPRHQGRPRARRRPRRLVRGRIDGLDGTARALRRVWRAQDFATSMTALLHDLGGGPFQTPPCSSTRLDYLARCAATARKPCRKLRRAARRLPISDRTSQQPAAPAEPTRW